MRNKLNKLLKTDFYINKKKYKKLLSSLGVPPIYKDLGYTEKDVEMYLNAYFFITYSKKENKLEIRETKYQILDTNTREILFETHVHDDFVLEKEKLYNECISKKVPIKFFDSFETMYNVVYPYTSSSYDIFYDFQLDNTNIEIKNNKMHIMGQALVTVQQEIMLENDFELNEIAHNTQNVEFEFFDIYTSQKGNKNLFKILKKSKMYKK